MLYQLENFQKEKKTIKEVYVEFRKEYVHYETANNGKDNMKKVNEIFNKKIRNAGLTTEQTSIVNGFFNTCMEAIAMGKVVEAEKFVKACLED